MKYSVIIADDEPNARMYLARLVNDLDGYQLLGTYKNGLEVVQFCKTMTPDIVLLDIEMPGLNGIETARQVMKINNQTIIIFLTAYDQYAVNAFEVEAIGYLLKPFTKVELLKSLTRAKQLIELRSKNQFQERIQRLWKHFNNHSNTFLEIIEVKEKGLMKQLKISDVLYIKSDSEYLRFVTGSESVMQRMTLKLLADQLPTSFKKIHRSYLLNQHKISKWKYLNNGTYQFHLHNGEVITSSRSYQDSIQQWIT